MNTMLRIAALAALALASITVPASAQAAKSSIDYPQGGGQGYLGDMWPGDRVNFNDRPLFGRVGANALWQDGWVVDLNANGTLTFTITSTAITAPPANFNAGFFLALYPDNGTVCFPEVGACNVVLTTPEFGSLTLAEGTRVPRRTTFRVANLVAGRYVFRISGFTGSDAGYYSGQLTLRKP